MGPRLRKLIGAIAFLFGLTIYAFVAAGLGNALLPPDTVGWAVVYFIIAGVAWVPLFVPLVRWMEYGSFRKPGAGATD
ncbi:MAG: DUF2842 domain-containing protein [Alphaproteobacteria bacterium]